MKDYWKVKAIALETELRLAELHKAADEIIEYKNAMFHEAGLDPAKTYKFTDEGESIEEDASAV